MKDVSLDDLIKKDKEKAKSQKKKQSNNKKLIKRGNPNKKNVRGRIQNNQPRKFNRQQQPNQNLPFNRNRGQGTVRNVSRLQRRPLSSVQNKKVEGNKQKGRTLKVLGLHPDFSNEDLYKLFSEHGALEKCLRENDNFGRELPTAIVKYHSADSATKAIQNLNQHKVMNSVLTVEAYKRINQ